MPLRLLASLLGLTLTFHSATAQDNYVMGPESMEQMGVPKGEITKYTADSKIYAGTTRDYWVYVPRQYDPKQPACVMVFQDGFNYQNPAGNWHATIVMDNLIHKKDLPVIIGIFINPGTMTPADNAEIAKSESRIKDEINAGLNRIVTGCA